MFNTLTRIVALEGKSHPAFIADLALLIAETAVAKVLDNQ